MKYFYDFNPVMLEIEENRNNLTPLDMINNDGIRDLIYNYLTKLSETKKTGHNFC